MGARGNSAGFCRQYAVYGTATLPISYQVNLEAHDYDTIHQYDYLHVKNYRSFLLKKTQEVLEKNDISQRQSTEESVVIQPTVQSETVQAAGSTSQNVGTGIVGTQPQILLTAVVLLLLATGGCILIRKRVEK